VKRADLEHLIRAASTIADDDELVIVGSQAVLAQFPDAPEEMLRSDEADIYPKNKPERWDLIDGAIGELSAFHETFGYYGARSSGGSRYAAPRLAGATGRPFDSVYARRDRVVPRDPRPGHFQVRRQSRQGSTLLQSGRAGRARRLAFSRLVELGADTQLELEPVVTEVLR